MEPIDPQQSNTSGEAQKPMINNESGAVLGSQEVEPAQKKARLLTLEEYEAALDQDRTFDNVDLDFLDTQ
jgi:hypothetical protein